MALGCHLGPGAGTGSFPQEVRLAASAGRALAQVCVGERPGGSGGRGWGWCARPPTEQPSCFASLPPGALMPRAWGVGGAGASLPAAIRIPDDTAGRGVCWLPASSPPAPRALASVVGGWCAPRPVSGRPLLQLGLSFLPPLCGRAGGATGLPRGPHVPRPGRGSGTMGSWAKGWGAGRGGWAAFQVS